MKKSKAKIHSYNGPQEEGRKAFFSGKKREENPYPIASGFRGNWKRWDSGWIKAKLAKEQNKPLL